jgi:hypothetical protein
MSDHLDMGGRCGVCFNWATSTPCHRCRSANAHMRRAEGWDPPAIVRTSTMPVPDSYQPSDTMPPSKHLRAADFPLDVKWKLNIADVTMELLEGMDPGETARNRLIISFAAREKGLILNTTNQKFLEGRLGEQPNAWIGAEIVLHRTTCLYAGKVVPAFRIIEARSVQPAAAIAEFAGKVEDIKF